MEIAIEMTSFYFQFIAASYKYLHDSQYSCGKNRSLCPVAQIALVDKTGNLEHLAALVVVVPKQNKSDHNYRLLA